GRRLAEPVDLLLQRDQLLARLAQRARQLVVPLGEEGGTALRLGDALLERTHLPRAVGDLAAQEADLLLEVGDLGQQRRDITLTPCPELVGTRAHRAPPHTSGGARTQIYTRGT